MINNKSTYFIFILFTSACICCPNVKWSPFYESYGPHVAALILARGGSKSIPLKNLAKVGDSSLLKISLAAISKTVGFTSTWVSTDHFLIAAEAAAAKANIHWRSSDTATDTASSIYAVQEFLKKHPSVDVIALIQCTSPFIRSEYLQEALLFLESGFECVFAATRSHKLRWKEDNDELIALNFDPKCRPRRQDWQGELIENGMFYFATRRLLQAGIFQNSRCKAVKIHERDSLEIDSPFHLNVANAIHKLNAKID